ncbi:hypothetical protein [Mucilaginibacter psychrotolerans]|uniref:Uncharacterized protein n=1 Tax=Mucilaginibacter psychrotolerans TaxID=1524096 RepID=A0A4Y8SH64_9SPHI|nr:hypothetical protein [Mucilaginibacter psychrotolerans]TFF38011.1 hypothetical protein E2R66_10530 [Mucilaginibacter psychrotolerans]
METDQTTSRAFNINRPCYIVATLIGIVFLILRDFSQAAVFLGLGLIFDPFDLKQPFPQRPFYQQTWLIVHLSIVLALIALEAYIKLK